MTNIYGIYTLRFDGRHELARFRFLEPEDDSARRTRSSSSYRKPIAGAQAYADSLTARAELADKNNHTLLDTGGWGDWCAPTGNVDKGGCGGHGTSAKPLLAPPRRRCAQVRPDCRDRARC